MCLSVTERGHGGTMLAKINLVIAVTALAMSAMGHVESLAAHRGLSGSAAFAQESSDQTDAASSQGDSEADANADADADADDGADNAVSAGGVYSGTIQDANLDDGMISAAITQIHGKISGTFVATFTSADYGPGFVKGKISSNGKITALLRFHLKGKCGLTFHGTFENGDEISGDYKVTGCKKTAPDHGTFQMTD
jgi:hypothetical protein